MKNEESRFGTEITFDPKVVRKGDPQKDPFEVKDSSENDDHDD